MLGEWVRARFFKTTHFWRNLFLLLFRPKTLIHNTHLTGSQNYFEAYDFAWGCIKISILLSLIFSIFIKVELLQFFWYGVFIFDFLIFGIIVWLVLRLLQDDSIKLDDVYFCFAYPLGAGIVVMTVFGGFLMASDDAVEGTAFFNSLKAHALTEFFWHFLTSLQGLLTYIGYIAIAFLIWIFSLFAWAMSMCAKVNLWRLGIALVLSTSLVVAATIGLIEIEQVLLGKVPYLFLYLKSLFL